MVHGQGHFCSLVSEIGVLQTGCPQQGKTRVVCSWVLGHTSLGFVLFTYKNRPSYVSWTHAQEVIKSKWFGVGLGILELGIGPVLFQVIHEYLALGHHKLKTLGFGFL
jgi:hypothetical protein